MRALAIFLLAVAPLVARAQTVWRIDPEASVIRFGYTVNDRPAEGAFRAVAGEGTFDPDAPEATRMTLLIDIGSLDLGGALETAFALSGEWFDAKQHPVARYRLARLRRDASGALVALGDLTIRGRTKVIESVIDLTIDGGRAAAEGAVAFDRRDFGVGVGLTPLFVSIGPEVSVRFSLFALPGE
jgi:polyisoprenoid-binding protein YceI